MKCLRLANLQDQGFFHTEKKRCLKWAIRGRNTCHMHGGKGKGSLTKKGKERARKAALRHGAYAKEAKQFQQDAMGLIRKSKNLIKNFLIKERFPIISRRS